MTDFDPTLQTRLSKYVTSDLLDELSDSSNITLVSQRLGSLYKALSSYLPQYIVENEYLLKQDYGSLTQGTFMFADVSGFTALSEMLMQKAGVEGTEILTNIINEFFTIMLEILAKSEGHLLKFAGDALLAFFPSEPDKDEVPKAVHTGLRMQRAMQERFQPIQNTELTRWFGEHDMELSMSIGICSGRLFEALAGNIAQRDHTVLGNLPGEAMAAEEAGERDDVIISAALREAYADVFEIVPTSEAGFYRVIDNFGDQLGDYEFSMPQRRRAKTSFLFSFDTENQLQDLENELVRVENISRFVSSEIVNKLVVKSDHIESENRLATVIFTHFTGFAELLDVLGEDHIDLVTVILSRYYGIMQRIVATSGGVLTRSDPYKLGCKLLITFGAPVAHPDDPDRAVATALEMNRQLEILNRRLKEELPEIAQHYPVIKQRSGITHGQVYAGEVGWRQRREYTVMGDNVNLAARLMAKAEFGQVFINQDVWKRVHPNFETEALPPFTVKGKAAPIQAYMVKGAKRTHIAHASDAPFVGRELMFLSLNMALQAAQTAPKTLSATALYGDLGVGKTRLAMQLAKAAADSAFTVAWATCHSQNTRKTTWSTIVAQLLKIDPHGDREAQQKTLESNLIELGVPDLKDVLTDLLFNIGQHAKHPKKSKTEVQAASRTRQDIFTKLSSEQSTAFGKDAVAQIRKRMNKALTPSHMGDLSLWNDLEMGMGLTDALIQFLEACTRDTLTLIVIDDLHKEHARALNILKRIVKEVRNTKLMILTAYEPTAAVDINMQKIAVADLPEEQTYLMVTALLNASELGERLSRFIWESTSGRALFIESLIQTLRDNDQLTEDQGVVELKPDADVDALPNNIRGLIISRVDRLSSDARRLLRAAAVLEDRFSAEGLAFVGEMGSADGVQPHLQHLLELQILKDYEDNGLLGFRHGVTQQAVYEELTRVQRQRYHALAADYFDQQTDSETRLSNNVYHLQKAGKSQRAAAVLTDAAQQAEQNEDIEQALELYTQAMEILPDDATLREQAQRLQERLRR